MRTINEDDITKFPDFINDHLDSVKVSIKDLDSGKRNFTLELTGNQSDFEKAKEIIKSNMADLWGEYSVVGGDKSTIKYSADKKGNFKMSKIPESNIRNAVSAILEGKDIMQSLLQAVKVTESTDPVYYEIVYGYDMGIVEVDRPTTDYGALVDILIDGLEDDGVGEPYLISIDKAEQEYNPDEYVIGGNHGLALVHNGNFMINEITKDKADEYHKEDKVKIYTESKLLEAAGRLEYVKVIDEPYGKGVEVKDTNGAIYRYAVDTHDPKYYTPEKVKNAVWGLAKKYNYDMGRIYNFLRNNTLGDYDKDVSNRAGLGKAEIVAEPNGNGLKVTLDNGKVFRYTVDTNDEKYDTLEKLKDGAEGMWRHGASVDGIINFLDNHALLYAREAMEKLKNRKLSEAKVDRIHR